MRGHAVARRFAEPDVARDDGVVDALQEERADVARDLLSEVRALVVHRHQHAGDVERRIEGGADAAQRRDEIGEPFEREVLAVERNQHGVGGDERVEREQPERGRRVDEDVVEAVAERVEQARAGDARGGGARRDRSRRRSGCDRRESARGPSTRVSRTNADGIGDVGGQGLVDGAGRCGLAFEPDAAREVGLRVHVDEEHALFRQGERGAPRLMAVVVLPTPPF